METPLSGWHDFFLAQAGPSSALVGLLFVSVSINLTRILKFNHLPTRALETLITLFSVLVISTFALTPQKELSTYGWELLFSTISMWVMMSFCLIKTRKSGYETWIRYFLNQAPTLPYVAAGIFLVFGNPTGLYWLVPGVLISFISGLFNAWVLLVEINR